MAESLEELIRQNNEFHNSLIKQNNELDRAFQSGTLGQLVHSWRADDDGGNETTDVEGANRETLLVNQSGGTSGEPEAGQPPI
ncbi:MAG: hypothetical protein K0U86_12060 [Planctomycetes bacterium]|nr:hypothetical protein [Planctomycetota bacterium]MCH9725619.1 hypothetical protein [Planctomycetota bacterium]MCH9777673.1 hypothetical protein [Planctomycetota bacterium]MCH9793275.1 hypothetical protein [Planctomycetota bacterium]MDF1742222.1 hypothetical protein [Gimesia sp.]